MTLVKICGIRSVAHARAALDLGANFLGFVFYPPSHRSIEPALAAEIVAACRASHGDRSRWQAVGIFVDEPVEHVNRVLGEAGLDIAQLCGHEGPEYCRAVERPVVRVVHVEADGTLPGSVDPARLGAWRLLFDSRVDGKFGGTGRPYRWDALRPVAAEAFLAGGLTPENVAEAVDAARPWAVDVSGGVERRRVKDVELIRRFIEEVRRVDRRTYGDQGWPPHS